MIGMKGYFTLPKIQNWSLIQDSRRFLPLYRGVLGVFSQQGGNFFESYIRRLITTVDLRRET